MSNLAKKVELYFESADIQINGKRQYDIKVNDDRFFEAVAKRGSLGLGESYMQGWWDCKNLTDFNVRLALAPSTKKATYLEKRLYKIRMSLQNLQDMKGAKEVTKHYNLSNDMYKFMLDDPYMQYSSGYFPKPGISLEEAQINKMKMICEKLQLSPGETVLEIGGGWGGLAYYMAKNYNVKVKSLNITEQQMIYARKLTAGLPVETIELDYRLAPKLGTFDKIVSIEMLEAVGPKNFRDYMTVVNKCLKPEGLALIQTIGDNVTRTHGNLWILRYIFPNGHIPSIAELGSSMEGLLVLEDLHNLSVSYADTLECWYDRFNGNWDKIRALSPDFDETFKRMWNYYLTSCSGAFMSRHLHVWHLLLSRSKSGRAPNYRRDLESNRVETERRKRLKKVA